MLLATVIHLLTSVMVGLLYGVMLPMFPRRPIVLGGVIAPLLWTGLLHASLQMVNPTLDGPVDWPWFVVTQIGFGVVAGVVVTRTGCVRTMQFESFAVRAGHRDAGRDERRRTTETSREAAASPCSASPAALVGCSTALPGGRRRRPSTSGPTGSRTSRVLYSENCAGCHGPSGRGGAGAIGLADPVYLAIADDARPARRGGPWRPRYADAGLRARARAGC